MRKELRHIERETGAFTFLVLIVIVLSACSTETFDACDFNEDGEVQDFEEKRCDREEQQGEEEITEEETLEEEPIADEEVVAEEEEAVIIEEDFKRDFAPIYVSIFTHIEETGKMSPDFLEDEEAYWALHSAEKNFAEMLYEEGVAFNFQSDWTFLEATAKYDSEGSAETKNKNLVRYMHEDLGVEIDPHAHETTHNYADVAYLIAQLGVEPSGIVGGFLASPVISSKVDYLQEPIKGNVYDYTWQAESLWGGGTGNHVNEEFLWASGIWRPKNSKEFFTHSEDSIPNIGKYKTTWEGLDMLLEKQKNGELDPDKIYTISIAAEQSKIEDEEYLKEFQAEIESYNEQSAEGKIVWVGLNEVLEIWKVEYNEEPNILKYEE